jgi:hypothetical protein
MMICVHLELSKAMKISTQKNKFEIHVRLCFSNLGQTFLIYLSLGPSTEILVPNKPSSDIPVPKIWFDTACLSLIGIVRRIVVELEQLSLSRTKKVLLTVDTAKNTKISFFFIYLFPGCINIRQKYPEPGQNQQ